MTDEDRCLLITDDFSKWIQLALGVVVLSSLWVKRNIESPRRPFQIWTMDVSKQAIGALLVHVINILLSAVFSHYYDNDQADECGVYFVTFALDVSLGTAIIYGMLRKTESIAKDKGWDSLKHNGQYGNPPNFSTWLNQLWLWLFLVAIMKLVVSFLVWLSFSLISEIGTYIFSGFKNSRKSELVLVMIIAPCCMNMIQFWICDSFLKERSNKLDSIPHRYDAIGTSP